MSQCADSTMRDSGMAHAWLCMTPIVQNCYLYCLRNSNLLYSSGSIPSMWSHKVLQCFAIIHATQELEIPAAPGKQAHYWTHCMLWGSPMCFW